MPSVTNLLWPTVLDVAMDLLVDLLTYDCPYSGRKRVAGQYDEGIETEPTTKLPSCSVFLMSQQISLASSLLNSCCSFRS